MPKTVKVGKVGWKKLQPILDTLAEAINGNAPIKGDGISLSETASGTIISTLKEGDKSGTDAAPAADGKPTGSFQTVIVFDAGGNPMPLNVWTDGTTPQGGVALMWKSLLTVDPSTCSTSSVTVLTHPTTI